MASPTTQLNSFLNLPTRLDISAAQWKFLQWQLLCSLRVAAPGIIQSFDETKQTCAVKLAIRENLLMNAISTPVEVDVLQDVPVWMPRAGGFTVTLPVSAGDECLLVFSDNCIDAWWESGGVQNQIDRRRHNLSDAVALVGLWNQKRTLTGYSTDSMQLRSDDGATVIEVQEHAVNITVNGTGNSVTVTADHINLGAGATNHVAYLESLETKFNTHTHSGVTAGGASSGPPSTTFNSGDGTTHVKAS